MVTVSTATPNACQPPSHADTAMADLAATQDAKRYEAIERRRRRQRGEPEPTPPAPPRRLPPPPRQAPLTPPARTPRRASGSAPPSAAQTPRLAPTPPAAAKPPTGHTARPAPKIAVPEGHLLLGPTELAALVRLIDTHPETKRQGRF